MLLVNSDKGFHLYIFILFKTIVLVFSPVRFLDKEIVWFIWVSLFWHFLIDVVMRPRTFTCGQQGGRGESQRAHGAPSHRTDTADGVLMWWFQSPLSLEYLSPEALSCAPGSDDWGESCHPAYVTNLGTTGRTVSVGWRSCRRPRVSAPGDCESPARSCCDGLSPPVPSPPRWCLPPHAKDLQVV